MKTFAIIAGILGVTTLLGWIVVQTLSNGQNEDSAYNMHPSNFEKPELENKIEVKSEQDDSDTLDLSDYFSDDKS